MLLIGFCFLLFCPANRMEEVKRNLKRPADDRDHGRYAESSDRKRSTNDRRFEAPPPPRFETIK